MTAAPPQINRRSFAGQLRTYQKDPLSGAIAFLIWTAAALTISALVVILGYILIREIGRAHV